MKTYKAKFKKGSKGAFAISLVKDPANTEHFIALSKQDELITLSKVDEEQRVVMGLVLQPGQLIPRYNEETQEEFNIVFEASTIKELSHNFFIANNQSNSKLEHEAPIKDVTIVESWIVENSKIDKSANFGMNLPKGSWMATMKINNDEIWNDYVKTNKVQGFSIDAFVDLEEVNLKSNINMSKQSKSILAMLKDIVAGADTAVSTEITLGSVKSGELDIQFEGEDMEVGTPLFVMNDEERIELPDGEYPIEDDKKIVVEGGMVASIEEVKEEKAEEPAEEAGEEAKEELADEAKEEEEEKEEVKEEEKKEELVEEEAVEEEAKDLTMDDVKEMIAVAVSDYMKGMDVEMSELKGNLDKVSQENVELKAELVTLAKMPADKVIKSIPTQVALTKEQRILNAVRKHS
tara:strand:+ start:8567 stop:9784 length:1218 start_codon:yes stop_codon:yes gene_type:complete